MRDRPRSLGRSVLQNICTLVICAVRDAGGPLEGVHREALAQLAQSDRTRPGVLQLIRFHCQRLLYVRRLNLLL